MKNSNKGYTATELLAVLVVLGVLAFWGTLIWVAVHFISKWW